LIHSEDLDIHINLYKTLTVLKRIIYQSRTKRTGLIISQVTDDVLYADLFEMQEMDELEV